MRQFIKSAFVLVVGLFAYCEARAEMATHIALHGEEVSYLGGEVNFPEIVLMNVGVAWADNGTTIKSQNHSIVFTTEDKWDDDYGPKLAGICMPNWVESFDISVDYRSESVKSFCRFSDLEAIPSQTVDGHLSKTFSSSLAGGGGFTRTDVDPVTTKGHMKIKRNFGSQRRAFKLWCVDAVYGDIIGSDYQSLEAYYNTFCRAYVVTQPGQGFKLDYEGNAASKKVVGMHTGEGDDIDDFGALTILGNVVNSIADRAFVNCEFPATKVVLPGGNFTVGACAFSGCTTLEEIEIVDSGKMSFDIGDYAFDGCTGLTSVHFPACVNKVGNGAFAHCSNLREFSVDDANSMSLSVRNGLLCDKLGLTLLACPATFTSVTIPSSITSIQYGAFMGCDNLTEVITDPDRVDWVAEQMLAAGFNVNGVLFNGKRYAADLCEVIFELDNLARRIGGGELVQMVASGQSPVAPEVVANDGWEFLGWESDFSSVDENLTVAAIYEQLELEDIDDDLIWRYRLDSEGRAMVIGVESVDPFWGVDGTLTIPSTLDGHKVTAIGKFAFEHSYIDSLVIPEGVTEIGAFAFDSCYLQTVVIPGSVELIGNYAFFNCMLEAVSIPDGVMHIGEGAFEWCFGLVTITIPASVRSIGDYAFASCLELSEVIFEGDETKIDFGYQVFVNTPYERSRPFSLIMDGSVITGYSGGAPAEFVIPEGVTGIGELAFEVCVGLKSIVIPASVRTIGDYAFLRCSELEEVIFEGAEDEIEFGYNVFGGTPYEQNRPFSLIMDGTVIIGWSGGIPEDLVIPEGVTGIDEGMFMFCNKLKSVTIPASLTQMDYRTAFYGSETLMAFYVDPNNPVYSSPNNLLCSKDGKTLIRGVNGNVIIPDGVVRIGEDAFAWHKRLTSVTIPSSVKEIYLNGDQTTFIGCDRLVSVCFEGDAPEFSYDEWYDPDYFESEVYEGSYYVTTYVREGTSGWGTVPGTWQNRPIRLWTKDSPSPIPDVGEDVEFAEAVLGGVKDAKIYETFCSVYDDEGEAAGLAFYQSYRSWAENVKVGDGGLAGLQTVKDSPTAWASFALDSATLLNRNPTDDDLKIESFGRLSESWKFDFTVSIKDVSVGAGATAENLKKALGLEGANELTESTFDESKVEIEFGQPVDGKLKFQAKPVDDTAKSFFMRMKVR